MFLRNACLEDLPALLAIHNHAVEHLTAVWSDHKDTLEERAAWLEGRQKAGFPVIVAEDEQGKVVGYGSYGKFRDREGYSLTIEHSVYVSDASQGKGVGKALMERLIELGREAGYHVLVAAVDGENLGSIAFHEKCGFEATGRLPQVGKKFGRWLDLVVMTLVLDDRPVPPTA